MNGARMVCSLAILAVLFCGWVDVSTNSRVIRPIFSVLLLVIGIIIWAAYDYHP